MSSAGCVVACGTQNKCKVEALRQSLEAHPTYPCFDGAQMLPFKVPSEISEQPMTLEETTCGADNRARNARAAAIKTLEMETSSVSSENRKPVVVGIGLESGLFKNPGDGRTYDVCVASVSFDGKTFRHGLSCAFEIPPKVLEFVHQGMDLSQACNAAGLTSNPDLGQAEGLIGILTRGRVTRLAYTRQAIEMAFAGLDTPQDFSVGE